MTTRVLLAVLPLFALAGATARGDVPCPSKVTVNLPQSICRFGSATASVAPIDGAAYAWLVTGGTIVSGNGTPRVTIAFHDVAAAHVAVTVSNASCTTSGQADIALHDVITARITVGAGRVGDPLTISWSYTGGEPAAQALTGTDFPQPLRLPPNARSYTYMPSTSGAKEVSITTSAGGTRRRAAGGGGGEGASSCPVAPSVTAYAVDECAKPTVTIEAPSTVLAGTVFTARATTEAQTVRWTITNGTPATADGKEVTVTAGKPGDVGLAVSAVRAGCPSVGTKAFTVAAVPELACDHPVATISAGGSDCSGGTVNVVFQGTPPFSGRWSDGQQFTTTAMSLARHITVPGHYTFSSFEDQVCAGMVNGTAVFETLGPVAEVMGSTACVSDTVTARFTGRPPFTGQWSDGVPINTTQTTIQRSPSAAGALTITSFRDADCVGMVKGSVDVHANPTVNAITLYDPNPLPSCFPYLDRFGIYFVTDANLSVKFIGANPPLVVNWSDGTVTSDPYPYANDVSRHVAPTHTTTYSVTSARDYYCPAIVTAPPVTIPVADNPEFVVDNVPASGKICVNLTMTAHLTAPPPAGATITWSVAGGSTITAGQGTNTVTFTTGQDGSALTSITCRFTYADQRCPGVAKQLLNIVYCLP